jgi:glutamine amidotransferase-like uncharacterized protein
VDARYSIKHVSSDYLNHDNWEASTALLVIPVVELGHIIRILRQEVIKKLSNMSVQEVNI